MGPKKSPIKWSLLCVCVCLCDCHLRFPKHWNLTLEFSSHTSPVVTVITQGYTVSPYKRKDLRYQWYVAVLKCLVPKKSCIKLKHNKYSKFTFMQWKISTTACFNFCCEKNKISINHHTVQVTTKAKNSAQCIFTSCLLAILLLFKSTIFRLPNRS